MPVAPGTTGIDGSAQLVVQKVPCLTLSVGFWYLYHAKCYTWPVPAGECPHCPRSSFLPSASIRIMTFMTRASQPGSIVMALAVLLGSLPGTVKAEEAWTWEQCLELARRQPSPELVAAGHAVAVARLRLDAEGSEYLPQVTFETGAGVVSDAREDKESEAAAGVAGSIAGKLLLYPGRERRGRKQLASATVDDASASAVSRWSDYRFRLRNGFIDLLYAQELVPMLDQTVKRRAEMVQVVERRYNSGQENKGALAVSRVLLAESRQEAADAARSLDLCRRQLARLLGWGQPDTVRVAGDLCVAVPVATNVLEEVAQRTPAFRAASSLAKRAEGQLAVTRARFGPQLNLVANASPRSDSWTQENPEWFAGLRLEVPLYLGGRKDLEVSAARTELAQAIAELQAAKRDLLTTVEAAAEECRSAAAWVQLARESLAAAELRADIVRREVEAGLTPLVRWEEAENDLARRRQASLKARREAARVQARWERLVGTDTVAGKEEGEP